MKSGPGQLEEELRAKGRQVDHIAMPDEGRGFPVQKNEFAACERIVAFLTESG